MLYVDQTEVIPLSNAPPLFIALVNEEMKTYHLQSGLAALAYTSQASGYSLGLLNLPSMSCPKP